MFYFISITYAAITIIMIYTVTFNPSLDYFVQINNIKTGLTNRTNDERLAVGGKGINLSLALKELGEDTTALGFVGGFTGNYIRDCVNALGLKHDFIEVDGQTRINVKIMSNTETDINGAGANVTEADVAKLAKKLRTSLKDGDWLVISGSVPASLSVDAYENFIKKIKPSLKGVKLVVDSNGLLLTNTLKYRPFLIKPNLQEMCEIFNLTTPPDIEGIFACARKLQAFGARNVIVSMGSGGAAMITENDMSMYVRAVQGQIANSVGAGDSMIAGFIHEYTKSNNYFTALNYGTAAGTACAFAKHLATKEQIEYIEAQML